MRLAALACCAVLLAACSSSGGPATSTVAPQSSTTASALPTISESQYLEIVRPMITTATDDDLLDLADQVCTDTTHWMMTMSRKDAAHRVYYDLTSVIPNQSSRLEAFMAASYGLKCPELRPDGLEGWASASPGTG